MLAAAALPLSYAGAVVTQVLLAALQILFQEPVTAANPLWEVPLRKFAVQFLRYWTNVGGAYVIRNLVRLRECENQAARFVLEKSQLEALWDRPNLKHSVHA